MAKTPIPWRNYLVEFLSIFLGIILAFTLNRWNEDVKDRKSEAKILSEIKNGLELDLSDIDGNIAGHQRGVLATQFFRNYINNVPIGQDSAALAYFVLWRDFVSIQNKSGYESLKSKGLEIVLNDSLRFDIIALYDFHYEILEKLEEGYSEMQYNETYFDPMNDILAEYLEFDEAGQISAMNQPVSLTLQERNKIMVYLQRMEFNRNFILGQYLNVKDRVSALIEDINQELEQ